MRVNGDDVTFLTYFECSNELTVLKGRLIELTNFENV